jgi:hypothetical protein
MPETLEPVAVPPPPSAHDDNCPFCAKKENQKGTLKSYIGKDNDPKDLERHLADEGQPRAQVGFEHDDYGKYSEEPHHLVSGNEALKGHAIESWLSKDAAGSEVDADSGFDVNAARNGIWLPSITDANRICKWDTEKGRNGKIKRVPAESEKGKRMWSKLDDDEKDLIAFAIMEKEELQFHKGNHRNRGEAIDECYIEEVQRLLSEIKAYTDKAAQLCDKAKPDKDDKLPPPLGINGMIYGIASAHMRWHVSGPPESWFVFISKLSRNYYQHAIDEGKVPWEPPYEGHPNH